MRYVIATIILLAILVFHFFNTGFESIIQNYDIQDLANISAAFSGEWFNLANGSYNTVTPWRWDFLIAKIVSLIANISALQDYLLPTLYCAVCLCISVISTFFLCLCIKPQRYFAAILSTLSWLVILVGAWGCDTIIISSFTWFPLYTIMLILFFKNSKMRYIYFLISLYLAYHISESANQLSLLFILIGFFFAITITKKLFTKRDSSILFLLAIPAIFCLFTAPVYESPDYPNPTDKIPAHVILDDGLSGIITPTVGPSISMVPTLDRPFVKATYTTPIILLSFFIAVIGVISTIKNYNRTIFGWCLILSIALILDTYCTEEISHIMPLATINRLIPHWFFFSLTPIVFALTIFSFIVHLRLTSYELSAFLLALFFIPSANGALLQSPIANRAINEYQTILKDNPENIELGKYLASPSLHILNTHGVWILSNNKKKHPKFVDVAVFDKGVKFFDSNNSNNEELKNIIDRNWHTRWHSTQNNNEWILMRLSTPMSINGIEPTPGNFFYTDYPRGIKIKVAETCSAEHPLSAEYKTIINMPKWQGELLFTKNGYPFYGNYSHIKIYFREPTKAQCWLIEKAGTPETHYDWSIAKVKVLAGQKS